MEINKDYINIFFREIATNCSTKPEIAPDYVHKGTSPLPEPAPADPPDDLDCPLLE